MQTVDVLRHDGGDFPRALERDDRVIDGVRLCALINLPRAGQPPRELVAAGQVELGADARLFGKRNAR